MKKSLHPLSFLSEASGGITQQPLVNSKKKISSGIKLTLVMLLMFLAGINAMAKFTTGYSEGSYVKLSLSTSKSFLGNLGNDIISWWSPNGFVSFYGNPERVSALLLPPGDLGLVGQQTNVSCNGGSDGTATVSATLGTAPYTYSWSIGAQTTASVSGLAAGSYTVTVTDNVPDVDIYVFTITEPTTLVGSNVSQTNVLCNGASTGTASVTASGGTGAYTYNWSSGGTSDTETGLGAGGYTCTITDANSCSTQQTFTITEPSALSITPSQTNIVCNGGPSNGTATVAVSGGTPAYTYSWTPGGNTTATKTGLAVGSYTCTITDANSCSAVQTFTITQPDVFNIASFSQTNIACNGFSTGTATISITGGATPYTYNWTATGKPSPTGNGTNTVTNLPPANWKCTVTQGGGCSGSKIKFYNITQPSVITNTVTSQTNINCFGGSTGAAQVNAYGGTGSLTFDWTPGNPTGDGTNTVSGLSSNIYIRVA